MAFLFVLSGALLPQGAEKSIVVDAEEFESDMGFVATVDGKGQKFVLMARWPTSFLVGGSGAEKSVVVSGVAVRVPLAAVKKEEIPEGADGALGVDALRGLSLGFDLLNAKIRLSTATKIGQAGAERYFGDLPNWEGPNKILRLPLKRSKSGLPHIGASVGGKTYDLALRISTFDTMIDGTIPRPKESFGNDQWAYLPGVSFGGSGVRWMPYSAHDDWASEAEKEGAVGTVALDAFSSRRVLVDLADDAIYVEELSPSAKMSLFLSREIALPLVVRNGKLFLGVIPGSEEGEDEDLPMDARVVAIADVPVAEWLADLESGSAKAAENIARRIVRLDKNFDLTVIGADGKEEKVPIDRTGSPVDKR